MLQPQNYRGTNKRPALLLTSARACAILDGISAGAFSRIGNAEIKTIEANSNMSRRVLIAGNWKMNKTAAEGAALVKAIKAALPCCEKQCGCAESPEILVCPPFLSIPAAAAEAEGSCVKIGAQNIHWADSGAFTGEVSAAMLKEAGVEYVIVGHSERRQYFGETDETVNKRAKAAVKAGFSVIVCVGETLGERKGGVTNEVVGRQTKAGLEGFTAADFDKIVIAYEPVWAIGTGEVASDAQAQEVHAFIRGLLAEVFGADVAAKTRILYGGSMKPGNAAGLIAQADIDGGLIGGAALAAADFVGIAAAARK
jgi:triosephosphate isomerase